jgi:hypothetical protein
MKINRIALLPLALAAALVQAEPAHSLTEALNNGKPTVDSRLRIENVDDDAVADTANAVTWRNRLGYRTAPWYGFTVLAEIESVVALDESYNSTANGRTHYATVADPEGTEWNQVNLAWDSGRGTQIVAGRQRIAFDNQRFIGNVGWRQNEQTFDALRAAHTMGKTTLRYAYVDDAHRVFGNGNPNPLLAEYDLDGHLLNASHAFALGSLTGYGYLIENNDLPLTSARTVGARFAGAKALSAPWKLVYAVELAQQADWRDGADSIDADYQLIEFGAAYGAYIGRVAREVLGGDGDYAFQTPFATLHAFNGWADKFLTTPVNGLVDSYFAVNGPLGPTQWLVAFHRYDADHGSSDYGSEWDASLAYAFKQRFTALAKIAHYNSDGFARDSDKLWLSLEYKY